MDPFDTKIDVSNTTDTPGTVSRPNQLSPTRWVTISVVAMSVCIILGNSFVCAAFIFNRRLRNITNHFVFSLAVSDLLVGAILIPFYIHNSQDQHIVPPMIIFNLVASLANICGCTYDRYIAIEYPLRYKSILTKKRILFILCLVWITPVLLAPIPKIWELYGPQLGFTKSSKHLATKIYIGFISFGILFVCILLASVYINVFRVARRHMTAMQYLQKFNTKDDGKQGSMKKNAGGRRRFSVRFLVQEIRATKLFAVIGLTFVVCWLPLVYINLADVLEMRAMYTSAFQIIALYTIFGNSLVNPIIYAFFQKNFRMTVKGWFNFIFGRCAKRKRNQTNKTKKTKSRHSGFELVFKEENGGHEYTAENIPKGNSSHQNTYLDKGESAV